MHTPGTILAHYKILEKLGEGGMGVVYKAQDTTLDRLVALKLLPSQSVATDDDRNRFSNEARAAAKISHPNVATVYEFGTSDGETFLAMEYVEGESLAKKIRSGSCSIDETIRILQEAALGLGAAHHHGVIHRDIKSENILLTGTGTVKITDFGLAQVHGHSRLWKSTVTVGTAHYMSPEQVRAEALDERTDIWSLGVVAYELLTGKPPFPGNYEAAVLYQIIHEQPTPIRNSRTDVPASLLEIVEKCLSKDRSDRFQSAQELVDALRGASPEQRRAPQGPPETSAGEKHFEAERRPVTVLLATMETGDDDAEALTTGLDERFDGLAAIIQKYGGMKDRVLGDKLMAVFGAPTAHENDPERAVRCAIDMMQYVRRMNEMDVMGSSSAFALRIAIHSGTAIAGTVGSQTGSGYSLVGDVINVTAGITDTVKPGEILVSADTLKLVRDIVDVSQEQIVSLKGKTQEVRAFPLVLLKPGAEPGRRVVGKGAFVGRANEIQLFEEAMDRVGSGQHERFFVRGEAGMGKTRLKGELAARARLRHMSVCEGKCSSFETNTPYFLWNTLLRSLLRVEQDTAEAEVRSRLHELVRILSMEPDEPYLASLLSLRYEEILLEEDEHRKPKIFEAAKKLLKAYAVRKPSLFLFEDLHWIDRFSQNLLEFVLSAEGQGPSIIVCFYRPEYASRSTLRGSRQELDLSRLPEEEARELMRLRIGTASLPERLANLIEQRSEGNPFFIEEIIKTLRERGIVVSEKENLNVQYDKLEASIPETVQGVILARIDLLESRIREVLIDASVIGREFSRPVLEHIVPQKIDVPGGLRKLETLELVFEKEDAKELEYLFKHYLIQEVAYNTILQKKRKQIHALIARAIESLYAERLKEFYEILAYHYERAEEWSRAAEYLSRAGQKAKEIYSQEESEGFAERKKEAMEKLFESRSEKRLGWVVLGGITAVIITPVAALMVAIPYWSAIFLIELPPYVKFEAFGSQILGNILFALIFFVLSFGYSWAGLVFFFLGVLPVFRGSAQLYEILEDRVRVMFSSTKWFELFFSEIADVAFVGGDRRRLWRHALIDPMGHVRDYSTLTFATWLREVAGNLLPPFGFGYSSAKGEVRLTRTKGRRQLRLMLPWLNTASHSRDISLTPSDPRGFYEQLETALAKWKRKR